MKILHILKSAPDESTKRIIEAQAPGNEIKTIELYSGGISYDAVVADVFRYDKVFCW